MILLIFIFILIDYCDAQVKFIDSGQKLGNSTTNNICLGDVDKDGDLDAFFANGAYNQDQQNQLWLNDGKGHFIKSNQNFGYAKTMSVSLSDLDSDDDLDAFFAVGFGGQDKVFFNDGKGGFTDSGQRLGNVNSAFVSLADLDGDNDDDAFICVHPMWENGKSVKFGNEVWLNDAHGMFSNTGQNLGNGYNQGASVGDIDGDGDIDAATASNYNNIGNKIWLNDRRGNFTESSQVLSRLNSLDLAFGDPDNDGDLDAFVIYSDKSTVYCCGIWFNSGRGVFNESRQKFGITPATSVCLGDLDKDGDIDAFVTGGKYLEKRASTVWLNNGSGEFTDSIKVGYDESYDAKLGDLDNDGDIDVFIANNGAKKIYLNIPDTVSTGLHNKSGLNNFEVSELSQFLESLHQNQVSIN